MKYNSRELEYDIQDRLLNEYGIDPLDLFESFLCYVDSDTSCEFLKDYCNDHDIDISDITEDEEED